ncbi:MAG TPA: DUF4294 domain-containing protein [Puia sp.]|nr:DUF4294 domain-containing protein [Puia sp.]
MHSQVKKYFLFPLFLVLFLMTWNTSFAQQSSSPKYGPNDTLLVPIYVINGDTIPARTLSMVWVSATMPRAMRKRMEEWTRLRNAVYVTYPYAKKAGFIFNEMNARIAKMTSESERKSYIKSREKDLKKEFADPLEKLSVYQGKILMKLINRQTGNNCYDIIKEYRGGFTARFWQTIAFFFGSSLKQPYDAVGDDKQIELFVQEVERMYHG